MIAKYKEIYCCGCSKHVEARLTDGKEVYPRRRDIFRLPFWKCDVCKNTVGCHYKTAKPTQPLGCIPTPELKKARSAIHAVLDPLWETGGMNRKELYSRIASAMEMKTYHTAQIRSVDEANKVLSIVNKIKGEVAKNE